MCVLTPGFRNSNLIIPPAVSEFIKNETEIFENNYKEWLKKYPLKFVLIKDTNIIDFYDSLESAFKVGAENFGLDDFFIKQILPDDTINISFYGKNYFIAA